MTDEDDIEFMRMACSLDTKTWSVAEPGTFLIRGKRYLKDNKKVRFNLFTSMNSIQAVKIGQVY